MAYKFDEFVYYGPLNLSYPCYKDAIESFLQNESDIRTLKDAIMAFNCWNFLKKSTFTDWDENDYKKYKALSNKLINQSFSYVCSTKSLLKEFQKLSFRYQESFFDLISEKKVLESLEIEVEEFLRNVNLQTVIHNKTLVSHYKKEISSFLRRNPEEIVKIICNNQDLRSKEKMNISGLITESEQKSVLADYIDSDAPQLAFLESIITIQNSSIRPDDDHIAVAKNKIEEITNELFKDVKPGFISFGVEFTENGVPSEKENFITYDATKLSKDTSYASILQNLVFFFDFFDENYNMALAKQEPEMLFTNMFTGRYEGCYNMTSSQQYLANIEIGTFQLYYDFLKDMHISLESVLGEYFQEIVRKYPGFEKFSIVMPEPDTCYYNKAKIVSSEIESILKQFYSVVKKGTIDFNYINCKKVFKLSETPSLIKNKYYKMIEDTQNEAYKAYMFFFSGSMLLSVSNFEYRNNFNLLCNQDIAKDSLELLQDKKNIEYLLQEKWIIEDKGFLKPTMKAGVLLDFNKFGSINRYYSKYKKILSVLEKQKFVKSSSFLFSEEEKKLIKYIYGNEYMDGWGIRNLYDHGNGKELTDSQNKFFYLWLLFLLFQVEIKIISELELHDSVKIRTR